MNSQSLRVLIADDDRTSLLLLKSLLERQGYHVTAVTNGKEAVEAFLNESVDLVLLDVSMPEMDGYEAARRIKSAACDSLVPIVFLTALTDEEDLARCIEAGGDDFLTKPYSRVILQAKLRALLRMRDLYITVRQQRDRLAEHQQHWEREQVLAEGIFDNIVRRWPEDLSNVSYLLRPSAFFNGDVILIARGPTGNLNVMLGDFTGHGLAAAVGCIPAAGVFYAMTAKGYGIKDIVEGMNRKLYELLPSHIFCAAALASIDPVRRTLSVWNGGLPDVVVINKEGEIVHRCVSNHLPLGIAEPRTLQPVLDYVSISREDRVVLFSDGLVELQTDDGMLGQERLEELLRQADEGGFQRLSQLVQECGEKHGLADDVAALELRCAAPVHQAPVEPAVPVQGPAGEWRIMMELGAPLLREVDLLPVVLGALSSIRGFADHRSEVFSILSELYNNAIDHGLLRLNSSIKSSAEGFAGFYASREQALDALDEGRIVLDCRHIPEPGGGCLVVTVEDSGPGFDASGALLRQRDEANLAGRGLQLVASLCESLTFSQEGSRAEAVFRWRSE